MKQPLLYVAWIQALIGAAGSLIFSNVLGFPPCVLCWYQRIFLYPLVIILAIGIARKDKHIHWYVLPLSVMGLFIALYHNLLYYQLIPKSVAPCVQGISCTTQFIEWFGFITIPFLSFAAFSIITICMLLYRKKYE
ncbi:disulfide bond formation protein B [Candidatus Roizmanbacteria bacterium CG10_big_fil_rev_8_21_14_0_10_45_7]|uniref:Disulfide bond formation protein B n=1 Tax=Candidatus Roizmanbacteria bacterium CG10_big_fil_rev_8_21_14_0_10_45_7 TaxID=1974854 RepID=A0A2M8KUA1_9BACT|nr:MAG: disulfide bond formation protein B [Candidatus Roizmanbacteria bacterium CG10_big_fil_rev_8_21_14_0_10_45_7]